MEELGHRLQAGLAEEPTERRICRGTLLSRQQYLYELDEGYEDTRDFEVADWHGDQSYPRKKKSAPQGARDDADRSGR